MNHKVLQNEKEHNWSFIKKIFQNRSPSKYSFKNQAESLDQKDHLELSSFAKLRSFQHPLHRDRGRVFLRIWPAAARCGASGEGLCEPQRSDF